ncbi:MAG: 16S rRNA (guanine(966)-N(2))-methyltransferase RsmD [Alphaproteobacteria bacterium]
MRIVAGRHRGRRLHALTGDRIRPTSDRARESLFNVLAHNPLGPGSRSTFEGARVLDAFAGTGALGLEALSRGAAFATFMERERAALAVLEENIRALGEGARARVLRADALAPPPAPEPASLAFLDPPYGRGLAEPALAALAKARWFADEALVIIELSKADALAPPPGFRTLEERSYGQTRFTLLRWSPSADG